MHSQPTPRGGLPVIAPQSIEILEAEIIYCETIKHPHLFPCPSPDVSWETAAAEFDKRVLKRRKL